MHKYAVSISLKMYIDGSRFLRYNMGTVEELTLYAGRRSN